MPERVFDGFEKWQAAVNSGNAPAPLVDEFIPAAGGQTIRTFKVDSAGTWCSGS